jgi:hypothetical protein
MSPAQPLSPQAINCKSRSCLSKKYLSATEPLIWECSERHRFRATPDAIKSGQWCLVCYRGEKPDLAQMRKIARARRGRCLSDHYVNDRTKLVWQCHRKHTWEAPPNRIKCGTWCPECAVENRRGKKCPRYGIGDMQALAKNHGGECLSVRYAGMHVPLEWQCSEGHTWKTAPSLLRTGAWCPECDRLRRIRRPLYAVERGKADVAIAPVRAEVARSRRARRKPVFWQ